MSDLINKQDVLDTIKMLRDRNISAYEYDKWIYGIKSVEDKSDIDLIDRWSAIDACERDSKILDAMDSTEDGEMHRTKRAIIRILAGLPSARKIGRWVKRESWKDVPTVCSECKHEFIEYVNGYEWEETGDLPNYCPNCGAYMRGGGNV